MSVHLAFKQKTTRPTGRSVCSEILKAKNVVIIEIEPIRLWKWSSERPICIDKRLITWMVWQTKVVYDGNIWNHVQSENVVKLNDNHLINTDNDDGYLFMHVSWGLSTRGIDSRQQSWMLHLWKDNEHLKLCCSKSYHINIQVQVQVQAWNGN